MERADEDTLRELRILADYQFQYTVGSHLFPEQTAIERTKTKQRVRRIYVEGKLLATVTPSGFMALTYEGAARLKDVLPEGKNTVIVNRDSADFAANGHDVFSKHVISAAPDILPNEEVLVCSEDGELVAVGRAVLSGFEMGRFERGVAVRVRSGKKTRN